MCARLRYRPVNYSVVVLAVYRWLVAIPTSSACAAARSFPGWRNDRDPPARWSFGGFFDNDPIFAVLLCEALRRAFPLPCSADFFGFVASFQCFEVAGEFSGDGDTLGFTNEKYRQPSEGNAMDTIDFCTVFGTAGTTDHDRFHTIDVTGQNTSSSAQRGTQIWKKYKDLH